MKKLILFLIRKRLGVRKSQAFRFDNQSSPTDSYFFTNDGLIKLKIVNHSFVEERAHVSLNWLLDDECKIHIIKEKWEDVCQQK